AGEETGEDSDADGDEDDHEEYGHEDEGSVRRPLSLPAELAHPATDLTGHDGSRRRRPPAADALPSGRPPLVRTRVGERPGLAPARANRLGRERRPGRIREPRAPGPLAGPRFAPTEQPAPAALAPSTPPPR